MTLEQLLYYVRYRRKFNPDNYIKEKTEAINNFFREEKLDSCVVGLSGGIDSALVLKLLLNAANYKDSPIKQVTGLFLPINTKGISGQIIAELKVDELVKEVSSHSVFNYRRYDLTNTVESLLKFYPKNMSAWAAGQAACIVRTPALYGEAALLQDNGFKSIVVGTTNKDEGKYIGFFGKASDAMVDLQLIADLHKSEVVDVAQVLKVPTSIINSIPTGDVWDRKVDEEMIGAPYWFIEMYELMKEFYHEELREKLINDLESNDAEVYKKYSDAIEKIHSHNAHKYKVGSPARYINIIE